LGHQSISELGKGGRRRPGSPLPLPEVPMGLGLGLTVEEADNFGNADESTIRGSIQVHLPTRVIKVGVVSGRGRRSWSWTCPSPNIAAILSPTPSLFNSFNPIFSDSSESFSESTSTLWPNIRLTFALWVSYGSTSAVFPRTIIANSP